MKPAAFSDFKKLKKQATTKLKSAACEKDKFDKHDKLYAVVKEDEGVSAVNYEQKNTNLVDAIATARGKVDGIAKWQQVKTSEIQDSRNELVTSIEAVHKERHAFVDAIDMLRKVKAEKSESRSKEIRAQRRKVDKIAQLFVDNKVLPQVANLCAVMIDGAKEALISAVGTPLINTIPKNVYEAVYELVYEAI